MLMLLITAFACDLGAKNCNLMYAPDQVAVTLEEGVFFADELVYVFEGDGATVTCTLSAGDDRAACDDEGSSLIADGSTLEGWLWELTPETLTVTVTADGVEQGTWSGSPAYTEDEPNGEGCGFRSYGQLTLDLSEAG